jgi:hypothetical protein
VDGIPFALPVVCEKSPVLMAAFTIDASRAEALLPGREMFPVRLWNGRGLLVVVVVNYLATTIGKYIEFSVGVACTHGAKPAPPVLPAMFMRTFGTGQFVFDLPVSSEVSVKGGKGIWGMPKHQANLDFREGAAWISAQYDLGGRMVTRFDVRRPSAIRWPMSMRAINYCSFRGMIFRSYIYFDAKAGVHLLKRGSARLVLGDSPRADWIRALKPDPEPLFAAYMPSVKGVLDDYLESWFITPPVKPAGPICEGLEMTYPLGYGQTRLPLPDRSPDFDLDRT